MANPVFNNTKQFQRKDDGQPVGFDVAPPGETGLYDEPGRMSYDGVLLKSAAYFLLALAAAVVTGMFFPQYVGIISLAAFVMSLVVFFRARVEPKPGLYAITLVLYGATAGGKRGLTPHGGQGYAIERWHHPLSRARLRSWPRPRRSSNGRRSASSASA